jgi:3-(3-hydroxy-phenyl)propionate hydroxylase
LSFKVGWLLNAFGEGFTVLTFGAAPVREVASGRVRALVLAVGDDLIDRKGVLAERYDARPGVTYLIRPDQYVAARWRSFDQAKIERAMAPAVKA